MENYRLIFFILFIHFNFLIGQPLFDEETDDDVLWFETGSVEKTDCTKVLRAYDIEPETGEEIKAEMNDVLSLNSQNTGFRSVIGTEVSKWPNGRVPASYQRGMWNSEKKMLSCAVKFFHEKTCINFVKKTKNDTNYINITKDHVGCFSQAIGKNVTLKGAQMVNLQSLNKHCWKHGTIVHELMHAVGFFHEQSRNDRDTFIEVHLNNIPDDDEEQFKTAVQLNLKQELIGDYDYKSIMHYKRLLYGVGYPAMTAKLDPERNNPLMGNRDAPTEMDVFKINSFYQCSLAHNETKDKSLIFLLGGTTQQGGRSVDFLSKSVELYTPIPPTHREAVKAPKFARFADFPAQTEPSLPSLRTGRRLHFAAVVDGKLIVGGGYTRAQLHALDTTEITDLSNREDGWHSGPTMVQARFAAVATVVQGKLYVCGGNSRVGHLKAQRTCETLNSETNQFEAVAHMHQARSSATAASADIFMFVIGGYNEDPRKPLETVERYTPYLDRWITVAPLSRIRCQQSCGAATLGSYIYVCGGKLVDSVDEEMNKCEKYSPTLDRWTPIGSMVHSRTDFTLLNWNGQLMAFGGQEKSTSRMVEVYDIEKDIWNVTGQIAKRRWGFAAVAV